MNGIIHVLELAAGQLWRVVLDSWGIAGIGLVAALLVIVRRDVRSDLRIMAALSVAVTTLIACIAPAALPPDQPQAWASGRYLDGMIIVFFLVGAAVLLRARMRDIRRLRRRLPPGFSCWPRVTVAVYIGTTVPTHGFGAGFNFAEPAVVTQNWTQRQRGAGHGGDARHARGVDRLRVRAAQAAPRPGVRGRVRGVRRLRGRGKPGGRGPDDQPHLAKPTDRTRRRRSR